MRRLLFLFMPIMASEVEQKTRLIDLIKSALREHHSYTPAYTRPLQCMRPNCSADANHVEYSRSGVSVRLCARHKRERDNYE